MPDADGLLAGADPVEGRGADAVAAAVDQARNYLHFLPSIGHPQGMGRLKSVSRRLRRAMRVG